MFIGDINSDAQDDIIVQTGINAWDSGYIWTALSNGNFFDFWSYNSGKSVTTARDTIYLGDFDANGKTDILARGGTDQEDTGYVWTALSDGTGFDFWSGISSRKVLNPRDKLFVGNLNRDGKDDLIAIGGYDYGDRGKMYIALSSGSSFDFYSWSGGTVGFR